MIRTTWTACALLLLGAVPAGAQTPRKPAPPPAAPTSRPASAPAEAQITAVAFSPDGQVVAAGGYQVVTLFAAGTGRELARLAGQPGAITSLQFSPDGRRLAVAGGLPGRRGEVRLWDVSRVKPDGATAPPAHPEVLAGPSDVVYSVAFSPNGRWLAAGSYDHSVTLWDLAAGPATKPTNDQRPTTNDRRRAPNTQHPIPNAASAKSKIQNPKSKILNDHTDAVYAVAFSPDSRLLASAAGDRTVKVWSVATGKRLYTLSEATAEVYAVAFSPDGRQLAAGGVDKTLRTWNVTPKAGTLAKSAFAHQGAILRVAYARDGRSIYTSGEDRAVKRWDAATLAEQKVFPAQPDWPQGLALSPNGRMVAVGCHNGALALYDAESGRLLRMPVKGVPVAQKPGVLTTSRIPGRRLGDQRQRRPVGNGGITLFAAELSDIAPRGAERGRTVRFTLRGARIADAMGVYFDDPAITAAIVEPRDRNAGVLKVDAALGPAARIGVHTVFVRTPHGTTGSVPFAVGGWPEVAQVEPNNTPQAAQKIAPPCTVVGAIDAPGDEDCYRFDARAGEELVFEVVAQPLRSRLQPVLALFDAEGRALAESHSRPGRPDALLGYRFPAAGSYVVQLRDYEGAGGPGSHYRLNVGAFPVVTDVYPLGAQRGTTATFRVQGFNLGASTATMKMPDAAGRGAAVPLAMQTPHGPLYVTRPVAVGEDPDAPNAAAASSPAAAQTIPVPCAIDGVLGDEHQPSTLNHQPALAYYYKFAARKGQQLILDVLARRLGSPLDSEIEVLDASGKPVERAVLRAVYQTDVTLSDRDSASTGIRLTAWDGVNIGDYMMAGREVLRVEELPRGPDSDLFFRGYRGQRLGYLGTTPEYHSVGEPVYKVEVHPPGSSFSPNGYPLVHVAYRNDDGGPLFGKDSHLEFTPPADGDYVVRISDARGQQGADYAFRLLIHPPRPDYKLLFSPEHPNVPKGGATVVNVECERYDGFDGPIAVRLEGLPPGFSATETIIEAGETSATLLLMGPPAALAPTTVAGAGQIQNPKSKIQNPAFRLVGTARIAGRDVVRAVEPAGGAGLITVLADPDVRVAADRREVVIHPGEQTVVDVEVDRQGKFGQRVPLDFRNLPFGVRVMNIGLNGILVTEQETDRAVTLVCEPWVKPQSRPFYVVANVEGGVANAAAPLVLRVEPAQSAAANRAARR